MNDAQKHNEKLFDRFEALTFDDVVVVPGYGLAVAQAQARDAAATAAALQAEQANLLVTATALAQAYGAESEYFSVNRAPGGRSRETTVGAKRARSSGSSPTSAAPCASGWRTTTPPRRSAT